MRGLQRHRYNHETLQVRFKDKSIADVLNMTVDSALEYFEAFPRISRKLQTLKDVGCGYPPGAACPDAFGW